MASDLFVLYSLLRRLMTRKCTTHKSKFPLDLWQNTCFPWRRFERSEVLDTVLKLAPNLSMYRCSTFSLRIWIETSPRFNRQWECSYAVSIDSRNGNLGTSSYAPLSSCLTRAVVKSTVTRCSTNPFARSKCNQPKFFRA